MDFFSRPTAIPISTLSTQAGGGGEQQNIGKSGSPFKPFFLSIATLPPSEIVKPQGGIDLGDSEAKERRVKWVFLSLWCGGKSLVSATVQHYNDKVCN